jgi:hypothetical protein
MVNATVTIRRVLLGVGLTLAPAIARAQQTATASTTLVPHKDPQLATVVGLLVPGGGQFYTERYGKAAGVFAGTLAGVAIAVNAGHSDNTSVETIGYVGAGLVWAYGWLTAANDARLFNAQRIHTTAVPFISRRNQRLIIGITRSAP